MNPEKGYILNTRLELLNAIDKFAVAVEKEGQTFEHRGKSKSGHFAKTIFYLIILSYTCEPWKCMSS